MDHAGATQYAEQQMQEIYSNLVTNVHCNPHTSKATEDLIDQVRYRILHSFNTTTDDYSVIFTSGATSSLKILAESFDFSNNDSGVGYFGYLRDNHTSVLGMREIVKTDNINCIEFSEFMKNQFDKTKDINGNSLYVYPAQCNFSGFKYPLKAIEAIQTVNNTVNIENSNRYVCLDAACFVSTNKLDLSKWRPDYLCLSFYKIFGYPTGLGALIVSRRGENVLRKTFYGGGTVKISLSNSTGWHCKRDELHER